jgi:hypothetical protein
MTKSAGSATQPRRAPSAEDSSRVLRSPGSTRLGIAVVDLAAISFNAQRRFGVAAPFWPRKLARNSAAALCPGGNNPELVEMAPERTDQHQRTDQRRALPHQQVASGAAHPSPDRGALDQNRPDLRPSPRRAAGR